jgi:hypothetical protein
MNRNIKIVLMFAPLLLFFVGLVIVVDDLRHPQVTQERCTVTGTGADAQPFKAQGAFLYKNSENIIHDVSLRCDRHGVVLINDSQLQQTPVKSGQGANLVTKQYHHLPTRWQLSVHTGPQKDSESTP